MKKQLRMNVRDMKGKNVKKQEDRTRPLKTADLLRRIHEIETNLFELQKQNEKLEQARAEAEEAYRQYTDLYDFAPVGYFTLTRDGNILEVNLAGANLLGMEREKLLDTYLGNFVSAASYSAFKDFFENLLSGIGKETCELTLKRYGPDPHWIRIEATCFEGGQTGRAVMMSINERKRVENELRVSVAKYKTLFDSFPLGITVSDEAGNILEVNPTAEKLLGVLPEEHVRRGISGHEWKIVRPDGSPMPPEEFASVRALKENARVENIEMGVVKPDDSTTWISVTAAPLPLDSYGVVVTYGDITERIQAEWELLQSEKRAHKNAALLRSVMESPQGIVIFALDINFCYTAFTVTHKKIMKSLWGVEIEIGKNILDVIGDPLDREKARVNFERVLNGEQFILLEEYGDSTKYRTWYEDRYNPIIDEFGNVTGIAVFVTDITERKHAEQAAHESQELLTLFLNHSPIYAFIKEVTPTESRVLQASNNFQEMIGIPGSEMIGKTMQELFPPELAAKITADDWNVIATGQVLKVDEALNDRYYSSIKFPLALGDKTLLAGYTIDVTERTQAEKALQESEHRFRSMIQEVQTIAVQGYGAESTIQYWNTASEKLYGYSAEEAIGKSLLELIIPPEMRNEVQQAIQQMVKTGQPTPAAELSLMRKDGSRVTVYSSHAVVSIPGLPAELFCLDVDLTESKRTASLMNARMLISEYADIHTMDELLQKALDEAEVITGSEIGFAHFLKEDQKTLHLQMWSTNTLTHMCTAEGKGNHYPVEEAGVWAECVATREPVIHNDYVNLPPVRRKGLPKGHAPIVRELVVPILRNDLVVMIMGVGNKRYDYDDNDVEAMTQLANSVWDIVQRKQAEEALKTSEKKYRLLHESMIDGFVSVDMGGSFLDCNDIYRNLLGYSAEELAELKYKQITPEKWHEFEADIVENQIIKRGYSDIYEKEYIRKDGTVFPVELHTVLLRDENGEPAGMWAIVRDITERKQAEAERREANSYNRRLIEASIDPFVTIGPDGKITDVNEATEIVTGFSRDQLVGEDFLNYFTEPEKAREGYQKALAEGIVKDYPLTIQHISGRTTDVLYNASVYKNEAGEVQGVFAAARDITERKQAEKMLEKVNLILQTTLAREQELARTDPLTGINNRRRLFEIAEHEFDVAVRYQQPLSVIMYDLDHFKRVNDAFDHSIGDLILQRVTQIVRDELRSADVIGRYGGEEFIVILPMTNAQQAFLLAERIRMNVEALRIETTKGTASVTLSIGIVDFSGTAPAETVEEIFRRADEAMYAAKQAGRNRTEVR